MVKVANVKFLDGSKREFYNFDTHVVEDGVAYFGRRDWKERLTVPLHSVKFISVTEE
jgi:hypothetical protein